MKAVYRIGKYRMDVFSNCKCDVELLHSKIPIWISLGDGNFHSMTLIFNLIILLNFFIPEECE